MGFVIINTIDSSVGVVCNRCDDWCSDPVSFLTLDEITTIQKLHDADHDALGVDDIAEAVK